MSVRAAASITFLIAGMLGCAASRPADVAVFASGSDLESANPLVTIHPLSRQVQRHVLFVTLVRYNDRLQLRPYFARAWTWSADRKTLRLTLLPSLHWHDGRLTTAGDVVFTVLAARNPRTGYPRAGDLTGIDTVLASGDSEVVVRFKAQQRAVPQVFA